MSECKLANCIDREYTAKYVEEFANNEYVSEHEAETIYLIAEGVRHIPSVTPKSDKPSGKWIEHPHERGLDWEFSAYECSNCHEWSDDDSNYCPNCGAKMVEEQTGENNAD